MIELAIRIALYWLFGAMAGAGIGMFADDTGTFTITVTQASAVLASIAGVGATYAWSRIAKARGRMT